MKVGALYRNKHTNELCRIRTIEEVPFTKERKITVVELDNGSRWGVTPLSAYWNRLADKEHP